MLPTVLKILIADDDEGDRKLIKRLLNQAELQFECAETASIEEALTACEKNAFDCAIVDYRLPGRDGLDGLSALHDRFPYMAMIMMTGQGDEVVAAEAMKRGASDYIPKTRLQAPAIRRSTINAVEKAVLQRKIARQQDDLALFNRVLVHDLKAPLNSIRSFAGLIEEGVQEGSYQRIGEYSRRIARSAHRTGALIDMLHQFTKADEEAAFETVEMSAVLDDTLANLEQTIRERGGTVKHDKLPAVKGNALQLMQLLQNLIGNGVKYCESAPVIQVSAEAREDGWLFGVRDNGIGVPANECKRIFEPFQRLHGTGKYEGTGLGLATCKKIVERHGGRIWCESGEGTGAAFFFTLQRAENKDNENQKPALERLALLAY